MRVACCSNHDETPSEKRDDQPVQQHQRYVRDMRGEHKQFAGCRGGKWHDEIVHDEKIASPHADPHEILKPVKAVNRVPAKT